ncbi:MAG: TrkA C-terminal domain-containing protein [Planctomycetota bacterium]
MLIGALGFGLALLATSAVLGQPAPTATESVAPIPAAAQDTPWAERLPIHPLVVLFGCIAAGMALGRITLLGLSLGSSGVLFAALAAGWAGYGLPEGAATLGLVLFVYCVGLTAGPTFFRAFAKRGNALAVISAATVATGAATTALLAMATGIPSDLAVGIFAGALTSTPALAAGTEAAAILFGDGGQRVSVGYGLAYPFGVIGVVLFIQAMPRLLGQELNQPATDSASQADRQTITRALVEVANPTLQGRPIADVAALVDSGCQISRHVEEGRLVPIRPDFVFTLGDRVMLVGRPGDLGRVIDLIGRRVEDRDLAPMDTERERRQVALSSRALAGKTLRELDLLGRYGVVVTRLRRFGVDFVPKPETTLHSGDMLTVVGSAEALPAFADAAGHRAVLVDQSDLISLGVGIALGVSAGLIPLSLPGGASLTLGLAGGPLLVGLVLGHFGRFAGLVGYLPRASRLVLMEVGLVMFLAGAGVRAGGALLPVLREHGPSLVGMAIVVAVVPMATAFWLARKVFKLPMLESLGGACGGMTSTPGLGAIAAKTDADAPVIAYAAAYPVALILMTLAAQLLVRLAGA